LPPFSNLFHCKAFHIKLWAYKAFSPYDTKIYQKTEIYTTDFQFYKLYYKKQDKFPLLKNDTFMLVDKSLLKEYLRGMPNGQKELEKLKNVFDSEIKKTERVSENEDNGQ